MRALIDVASPGFSSWIRFLSFTMLLAACAMTGIFVHVSKQAETDQQNLAAFSEQQVLSQRMASSVVSAFSGDHEAFERLARSRAHFSLLLDEQRDEFERHSLVGGNGLSDAYTRLRASWDDFDQGIALILDEQALIMSVVETARVVNEVMPQIVEFNEAVVEGLVKGGASASQVGHASRQSFLGERMINSMNSLVNGADSPATPVSFAPDAREFGRVLVGLINGRNGIQSVSGKSAQTKLRKISTLFSRVKERTDVVADNDTRLAGIQGALSELATQHEQLYTATTGLKDAYTVSVDSRLLSMELVYLLGAVVLVVLLWIGIETMRTQRRSSEVVEDESVRTQEAIQRLLDEMGALADGDLTVRATVTENYTGAIADSINVTVDSLRGLVKTINDTATQMSSSVHETENIAQQLSDASRQQSSDITTAGSVINKMATSLNEMSSDASESSKVAMQSVEIAKKGGNVVKRTMEGMDTIRNHIQETSKRIKRLGESSQEVGDIVELINDIAEQTNILALNASIQAAMAGEAGRGFAVVADEVQRLAERSANATKQIEALVKTIQADTNEAVISMEKSTAGVVNGAQLAEDAGSALEEIENVSEQLAGLIQTISGAARQQAGAAADISNTMNGIQDITTQTSTGADRTSMSIGELSRLAQDLGKSVAGFKLPNS